MSIKFEVMERADNFDVSLVMDLVSSSLKNLYIPFAFDLSQGYKLFSSYYALDLPLI